MPKFAAHLSLRDLAGILLMLIGLQLRAVQTFELSSQTTQLLAGMVGPAPETPRGALRQFVIETTEHRHRITPPPWLGWLSLSLGGVCLSQRLLGKR
jgi:hypothetical protein